MSTAIGAAAANKQKNRFANIVACKFSTYQSCHYIASFVLKVIIVMLLLFQVSDYSHRYKQLAI